MVRRFDDLGIGGAMSGLPLALRMARHDATAFIERDLLGGTCLNRGCVPTRTMVASAKVAQQVCRTAPTIDVHRSLAGDVNAAAGGAHRPSPHTHRGPDA